MLDTVYCLTRQHNPWLVLLAAAICLTAACAGFRLLQLGRASAGERRSGWLTLSGLTTGGGVWATHFIAMLAFDPGVEAAYDGRGVLISLALALAFGVAAANAAVRLPGRRGLTAWSLLFAAGVGLMHYSGMWALEVPARPVWNLGLVGASVVLGAALSAAALATLRGGDGRGRFLGASALLAGGVCTLHFIGMAAVSFTPDPTLSAPTSIVEHDVLAVLVGVLSAAILCVGLLTLSVAARSRRVGLDILHAVIDVMPQGLAYYDAEDRFVLGNATYRASIADIGAVEGVTFREMLRRAAASGRVTEAVGREAAWVEERMQVRANVETNRNQPLADGTVLRIENRSTADGGAVTVFSDVTALVRQADDLATALDAAEAATRAKSAFLANMSHELHTPMNGVVSAADMLAAEPLAPRQAELVQMIRTSSAALNRLLSDLLDLAQGEVGGVEIQNAAFDPRAAAKAAVFPFAAQAQEKGLALSLDLGPDLPATMVGDELRLRQILDALVSNAVKFTDQGRVDVAVTLTGGTFGVAVSDTGVGIAPEQCERVFGRFELGDQSFTRQHGGAGLGLALAHEVAARMGGALACESKPGVGSIFTLTLPLAPGQAASSPAGAGEEAAVADGSRMLVVDDNPTNRRVLGLILESAGVEAVFAVNGQEAIDAWSKSAFDAILMDIQMPVMDGLSATRMIRSIERRDGLPRTPIVVVSANAMPEHRQASAAVGADAHVAKPVSAATLFQAIDQLAAA